MRRRMGMGVWFLAVGLAGSPPALAQKSDSFQEAIDLKRYRKGSVAWDTQELIASGLTALHEEHQQILKKLEELERQLSQLKQRV